MSDLLPLDVPTASRPQQREQAAIRRQAYPYRFPRDSRRLGGAYTVADSVARLTRFFYLERRLAQAIGAWALAIPDFEVKVESGRHLYWHADAARRLRERLHEQEKRVGAIDAFRDADIDRLIDEVLSAADAPELLVGVHQVLGRALETAYHHHAERTCQIADAPTVRVLAQILVDYQPMLAWADQAIAAYVAGGIDQARLERWRWHCDRLLASIGGVTGADRLGPAPTGLRSVAKPFVRDTAPRRDARFETFDRTGDYDTADGGARLAPGYEKERLGFIRAQRDEIDAIEAFGTVLWDIRFSDFDSEYRLARMVWDEARHTEIGNRSMMALGFDPFELPNRLTPSTCRGPMEPTLALAEINMVGEVGVLKMINGIIDEATSRGDALMMHIADHIRADERTHVRSGQVVMKNICDLEVQELDQRMRAAFTRCLYEIGAITKGEADVGSLSRESLEHLIGE
ncbi:MAG: hypothetical protein H0W83_09165 [Planctomycetes bacterium]|nr:hypothetical protein [Planctomycetota bacterium]